MSEIEHFLPLLMQREEEGALAPLLSHGKVHFLWIKHSNLYCILPPWAPGVVVAQVQRGWAEGRGCKAHQGRWLGGGDGRGQSGGSGSVLHLSLPKWHLFLNLAAHSGGHHAEERQCLPGVLLPLQDRGGKSWLPIGRLVCLSISFACLSVWIHLS